MKTHILFSPAYATLSVDLDPGESINAEPGAMVHQSNVDLHTGAPGGIFKGLRRMLAKESFFINTFTAGPRGGNVTLAPNTPGDIIRHPLEPGDAILIQAASFLASSSRVDHRHQFPGPPGHPGRRGRLLPQGLRPKPVPRHRLLQRLRRGPTTGHHQPRTRRRHRTPRRLHRQTGLLHRQGRRPTLPHRRRRGHGHEVRRRRGHRLGPDPQPPLPRRPVASPPPTHPARPRHE